MYKILNQYLFKSILKKPNTRFMQTTTIKESNDDYIKQDPLPNEKDDPLENSSLPSETKIWINELNEIRKGKDYIKNIRIILCKVRRLNLQFLKIIINEISDFLPKTEQDLYVAPIINKEVLLADMTLKTIAGELEVIDEKLNLQINKSEELAQDWNHHIIALDKYIESLKKIPWKKVLSYSACILAIIGFLWKMGMLRSIPSFGSNVANLLIDAGKFTGKNKISNTDLLPPVSIPTTSQSLPNMDNFKTFMESPITPIVFVSAVGVIAICLGALKIIVWVLRKTPK